MIQLLRLLKGYVEFSAEGGFPERFINLCNIRGINLWNVKNDGVKVVAFTTVREFEELKIPAENSGMSLSVIKFRGAKSFANRHKWRCGVALGIIMAFCFWFFMSGYIWEVEVLASDGVNVEAFTESLGALGVKVGARKSKIDIIQVQNELMNEYSQLLWVSVNIFGGKAQVEMSEFIQEKEITDTKKPINVVAGKKGEIVLVKGYNGINAVKEGDNVTKGTLLISGVVRNFDGSEYFTHARGEVFARTENKEKITYSFKNDGFITAQRDERYYLYIFSLRIPLGFRTKGDLLSENALLLKSKRAVLPFGIIRDDNLSLSEKSIEYSSCQAMLSGLLEGVKIKREKYNKSDLKKVEYRLNNKIKYGEIIVAINCIEDIAEEKAIQTEP